MKLRIANFLQCIFCFVSWRLVAFCSPVMQPHHGDVLRLESTMHYFWTPVLHNSAASCATSWWAQEILVYFCPYCSIIAKRVWHSPNSSTLQSLRLCCKAHQLQEGPFVATLPLLRACCPLLACSKQHCLDAHSLQMFIRTGTHT